MCPRTRETQLQELSWVNLDYCRNIMVHFPQMHENVIFSGGLRAATEGRGGVRDGARVGVAWVLLQAEGLLVDAVSGYAGGDAAVSKEPPHR